DGPGPRTGDVPPADDRRPGRPRRARQHGPRRDDPRGVAASGRRPRLPRVPLSAGEHRGLQRIAARLHADHGLPGPRGSADRGEQPVLRGGADLPGAVRARADDPAGVQPRPGDDAPSTPSRHPPHHGRGLGAHRLPRPHPDDAGFRAGRSGIGRDSIERDRIGRDRGVGAMTTSTTTIVTGSERKLRRHTRRVEPIYYLFLLPTLLLFTLAITVPGVVGIFFSFTDSIGIGDWSFNGLTNY